MERDFSHYHCAIAGMARDPQIMKGARAEGLRALTRAVAHTMGVDVVGFWAYDDLRSCVISEVNYQLVSDEWTHGQIVSERLAPKYFSKLKDERVLAVSDCLTSPYTVELRDVYCLPNNIRALVDVPVLFDGEMVGIICCEVIGHSREWSSEDKFFALLAADFIGRILEADKRRSLARQLEIEHLRLGETQLKALLTVLPLPLAMLDSESRYMTMSDAWIQQYTFHVANPFGAVIWDAHTYFHPDWKERILRAQKGERQGLEEEYVEATPGVFSWFSWQLIPWHNIQGDIGGVVLICEDITYRKESEVKLRQTAKLTALGEMAGGIAHEINNPLSIMKGFIDLMRKSVARGQVDVTSFSQYLERSANMIQRISRIIQAMKRISRDSSQDAIVSYGVNALINEVLEVVQEKFRHNEVKLVVSLLADEVNINCRPIEISQVLLNLLTNALHAVSHQTDAFVRLAVIFASGVVRFSVEDNGTGISVELREKIFHPFFTTKDIGQGTGLGLSISRKMIENQAGKLYLDHSAKHTTFIVELPL